MAKTISEAEIEKYTQRLRNLSNRARYDEAYALSKRLVKEHPTVLIFAYNEAVMTAEDDEGYTPAEVRARYRSATRKLRVLLRRLRSAPPQMRFAIRNEYYWFSSQPRKQYRLGLEEARRGLVSGYYSQGVGAVQLAKQYGLKGQKGLFMRWARKSEKAWLKFLRLPRPPLEFVRGPVVERGQWLRHRRVICNWSSERGDELRALFVAA